MLHLMRFPHDVRDGLTYITRMWLVSQLHLIRSIFESEVCNSRILKEEKLGRNLQKLACSETAVIGMFAILWHSEKKIFICAEFLRKMYNQIYFMLSILSYNSLSDMGNAITDIRQWGLSACSVTIKVMTKTKLFGLTWYHVNNDIYSPQFQYITTSLYQSIDSGHKYCRGGEWKQGCL